MRIVKELWRYLRQIQVVGDAAQRNLRAASVSVRDAEIAGIFETLYLAGAGVGALAVSTDALALAARALNPAVAVSVNAQLRAVAGQDGDTSDRASLLTGFSDETARSAAAGALAALSHINRISLKGDGDDRDT